MMQNVPSIELSRRLLHNEINRNRVAKIMAEAAKPNQSAVPPRARSGGGRGQNHRQDLRAHHHTRELHSQHYYPGHDINLDMETTGAQEESPPLTKRVVNRTSSGIRNGPVLQQPYPLSFPLTEQDQVSSSRKMEHTSYHIPPHSAESPGEEVGPSSVGHMHQNHSDCCNGTLIKTDPQGQSSKPASTAVHKPTVITPSPPTNRSKRKYCPSIPPDLSEYESHPFPQVQLIQSPRPIIDTLLHMRGAVRFGL